MNILLINNIYLPFLYGGAERSVRIIGEELLNLGNNVSIICTVPRGNNHENWINGVHVYYIGLKNLYWPFHKHLTKIFQPLWHMLDTYNPFYNDIIHSIIKQEKPDIVHTNNLSGFSVSIWDVIKSRSLPLIHSLRDYYLICPRTTMFKKGKNCLEQCAECRIYSLGKKKGSKTVDAVIGISKYILKRHLHFGYFSDVYNKDVIYNPYIPSKGVNKRPHKSGCPINIGYLGRLHSSKGIEILLKNFPDTSDLWIAGVGEKNYDTHLRTTYQKSNIHFLGFVNPSELLNKIDLLVVPSIWNEPMGRTVVEAYAFGIPVIASNRGGLPELIEPGKTGFIFDPSDSNSFNNILDVIITNPELLISMRQNCMNKMHDFDPSRVAEKHLKLYKMITA